MTMLHRAIQLHPGWKGACTITLPTYRPPILQSSVHGPRGKRLAP
jgi:hypothetical protein